jgi:steroid delta-isomerase
MTNQPTITEVFGRFYAALRSNNVAAWLDTFAEDAIAHDPVGMPPHHGHDGLKAFLFGVFKQFVSFGLIEDDVFLAPNGAAVRWTGRGQGRNGRYVEFAGIDVFDFGSDGRIRSLKAYWDAVPVLTTLALPSQTHEASQ